MLATAVLSALFLWAVISRWPRLLPPWISRFQNHPIWIRMVRFKAAHKWLKWDDALTGIVSGLLGLWLWGH